MTRQRARPGVALLLALVAVVVVVLMGTMAVDAARQDLRLAQAGRAQLAAAVLVDSALADWTDAAVDSVWWKAAPGAWLVTRAVRGTDSVGVAVHRLAGGLLRVSAVARTRRGGRRGDAGAIALFRLVPDPAGAAFRLGRLPGFWWAPDP